jgi:galactitol-specific phosphotransferase system IIC component
VTLLFSPFVSGLSPYNVDIFMIFHFGLAGFFMHCLLQRNGLSWWASFIGAVLFAFVGSVALRAMAKAVQR